MNPVMRRLSCISHKHKSRDRMIERRRASHANYLFSSPPSRSQISRQSSAWGRLGPDRFHPSGAVEISLS